MFFLDLPLRLIFWFWFIMSRICSWKLKYTNSLLSHILHMCALCSMCVCVASDFFFFYFSLFFIHWYSPICFTLFFNIWYSIFVFASTSVSGISQSKVSNWDNLIHTIHMYSYINTRYISFTIENTFIRTEFPSYAVILFWIFHF